MNKKLTILCASAALLFSSCWHPPFDPLVSASEFTVDKLGSPVWSATVTLWDEAEGGYYLPSRDPSEYYTGAWIRKKNGTLNIGKLTVFGEGMFNFNPNRYNAVDTLGSSTVLINPPGLNTANSTFYVASNTQGFFQLFNTNYSLWPPNNQLIGIGAVHGNIIDDLFYMAEWDGTEITIEYIGMNSSTLYPVTPVNGTFTNASPIPVGPAFFATTPVNTASYYLSGPMANGSIETYYWTTTAAIPLLLPIHRKLTGILSNGWLLADEGDKLYVYSADGTDSFSIPTGLLRFVHERTPDGITWISVFTRTVMIPGGKNDEGSEYLIEIYEIPTADLRDLAK